VKLKSVLLAAVLALVTLSLASAKSYTISFANPTKVGSVQLKAGEYKLQLDGTKATFTSVKSHESFSTDATKVESVDKSFENTRIDTSTDNGSTVAKDIEVGGSKIKIDF
jgi:opacity protein-like surface antigen